MNVEIGAEAALFPEKDYINGIFVVVCTLYKVARGVELWMPYVICLFR
jgi:hypothetical protein